MFRTRGTKFRAIKRFGFGGWWPHQIRAFKVLDDGTRLLYLTAYGACLFDTGTREIVAKAEFKDVTHQWSGFALSPTAKLLAIAFSMGGDDPLGGGYCYSNGVRIYDLSSGVLVGEEFLLGNQQVRWTVDFSENGRQLRVASDGDTSVFDLAAVRSASMLLGR